MAPQYTTFLSVSKPSALSLRADYLAASTMAGVLPLSDSSVTARPSDVCPNCQEDITGLDGVIVVECKHIFHQQCLRQWLVQPPHEKTCRGSCPVCRRALFINPGHETCRDERCRLLDVQSTVVVDEEHDNDDGDNDDASWVDQLNAAEKAELNAHVARWLGAQVVLDAGYVAWEDALFNREVDALRARIRARLARDAVQAFLAEAANG